MEPLPSYLAIPRAFGTAGSRNIDRMYEATCGSLSVHKAGSESNALIIMRRLRADLQLARTTCFAGILAESRFAPCQIENRANHLERVFARYLPIVYSLAQVGCCPVEDASPPLGVGYYPPPSGAFQSGVERCPAQPVRMPPQSPSTSPQLASTIRFHGA